MIAYNRLRPLSVRVPRAAVALVLRSGIPLRGWAAPAGLGRSAAGDGLLGHLAAALGEPEVWFATGFRLPHPFLKPTLQLFDRDGRPIGYAKVGWNPPTNEAVQRETDALANVDLRRAVAMPDVLWAGTWQDRTVLVTAPLPADVRRVPRRRWPCIDEAVSVARAGAVVRRPLGASSFVQGLLSRSHDLGDEVQVAAGQLARVADVDVDFGHAHGDWVPWNLAAGGRTTWVFDWELHLDDAPVGFDLVHWAYQRWAVGRGRPMAQAAALAAVDSGPLLASIGVYGRAAAAVAAAHHLTVAEREARARADA